MIALLCAILSGAMFFFSMGLNTVWPLAWIAPVPLLWLAYGRTSGWQVFAASIVAYAIGQLSLFEAYWGMAPLIASMIAVTAIIHGGVILFARLAQRHLPAVAAMFAYPALWTVIEYLNAGISPNGSAFAFAYAMVPAPLLIQSASLFGLWSITFLICATASAIALTLREGRGAAVAGIVMAVLFAANLAFGLARLAAPEDQAVSVAALGNGEGRLLSTAASAREVSQQYAKAAMGLAAAGARDIVLPEEIAMLKPQWRDATAGFAHTAQSTGSHIVAGYREVDGAPRNVALTFSRDGRTRYVKRHLIPGLEPLAPGHEPGLLGHGRAVAICKDMDFPSTIRGDARHGIRILFVPAWDFDRDGKMHADMAILRGVENGFAMVRAARRGLLTITDAQGRVIASAKATGGMTSIMADVPPGHGPTLYTRIGDVFAWLCMVLTLALAVAMILCRLRVVRRSTPAGRGFAPAAAPGLAAR
jgi:apolipoprotein N-acyltransferase